MAAAAAASVRRVVFPCRAEASRVLTRCRDRGVKAPTRNPTVSTEAGNARRTSRKCAEVDVFLSHRGVDTKSSVAGLLYDRLVRANARPFLDSRSMEPGDKIYERIHAGIRQCRVGVAIFSPRYCDSVFCLHELALMVEADKKLIPIFCDVKPSELAVSPAAKAAAQSQEDLARYARAIREAKHTVGLTFDSKNGDWSDLVSRTTNIVLKCLKEAKH
ncbi:TIR-only protein-like [Zingiber officinale]|uniref:TIR-only protein-like n=1 Tax=Zingiber officinale TaxID=94328 RepID=UPI001C4BFFE5|nr:TIR-only protein-like [Zingiber officinale]